MTRPRKVTETKKTTKARPRAQENLGTTDYVEAADTGHLLRKLKDELVCFELRDLNRIESRLEKAQGSSSAKDYQGLSLFCAGAFIGLATFTISLYLNAIAPPPALAFITSVATVLSLILTIIFWQISRKFGVIKADLIGEVMEEIKHHKAKFLR